VLDGCLRYMELVSEKAGREPGSFACASPLGAGVGS